MKLPDPRRYWKAIAGLVAPFVAYALIRLADVIGMDLDSFGIDVGSLKLLAGVAFVAGFTALFVGAAPKNADRK